MNAQLYSTSATAGTTSENGWLPSGQTLPRLVDMLEAEATELAFQKAKPGDASKQALVEVAVSVTCGAVHCLALIIS